MQPNKMANAVKAKTFHLHESESLVIIGAPVQAQFKEL